MAIRRRSTWWVRELSSQTLHRIGGKLYNEAKEGDLSDSQEALWTWVVAELEYRARRITPADRCTCLLCHTPTMAPDGQFEGQGQFQWDDEL